MNEHYAGATLTVEEVARYGYVEALVLVGAVR